MKPLLFLGLMIFAAGLAVGAQAPVAADRSLLTGTWQLDESGPPENEKNWRRRIQPIESVEPCLQIAPRQELDGSRAPSEPCPQAHGVAARDRGGVVILQTLGKTLIAPSLTLTLQIDAKAVTITDDSRAPTSFALGWRGHRLEVPISRTYPSRRSPYITAVVKTRWQDDALVQDLAASYLSDFKMTRVFKPADAGRRLLMLIQVKTPKLTPPVAAITRVYVRVGK
jgi:hypothetical protein